MLLLDNDNAGHSATENIQKELNGLDIENYDISILLKDNGVKDPNDLLIKDSVALKESIKQEIYKVEELKEAKKQEEINEYMKLSAYNYINDFMGDIYRGANTSCTPTGYDELDKLLDGGLYEGLYIIGAISSLGKTTFTLQMADQIAMQGKDVIIFSLEMARSELMAKSISRNTKIIGDKEDINPRYFKTNRGITTSKRYKGYEEEEKKLISRAVVDYSVYAKNLYIYEGIGDIGVEEIKSTLKKHIEITGRTPIIIIDYLQILKPYEVRATDKQNTDKAVLELKRLSRDYKTTVFAISSFNRENYTSEVSSSAFKESGAIEYSSDVLIGLQVEGLGTDKKENIEIYRNAMKNDENNQERRIELKILKNGVSTKFTYYPLFNYFVNKIYNNYI